MKVLVCSRALSIGEIQSISPTFRRSDVPTFRHSDVQAIKNFTAAAPSLTHGQITHFTVVTGNAAELQAVS